MDWLEVSLGGNSGLECGGALCAIGSCTEYRGVLITCQ
jgi:hypothetical protein